MPLTLTSTAYSAIPKEIVAGVNSCSFDYTSPAGAGNTFSASANATVVLGQKIQNGQTILMISGSHSSGADSCPVDIGYDDTISAFASAKTQGTNAITTKSTLPFLVSVSDDATANYRTLKYGFAPGTNTAVVNAKYTVYFTRDA